MKPLILISSGTAPAENYIHAIASAGGACDSLYCPKYDEKFDGLILAGGGDIDPGFLNEENRGSNNIDINRDRCEFGLIYDFLISGKPIFGICRGAQIINVYFSGTLIQDLPEQWKNAHSTDKGDALHKTRVIKKSPLEKMFGPEFITNSSHHQAIRRPGLNISVIQWSHDRIIEGIRHMQHPVWGVQWHPERMCAEFKRPEFPDTTKLFERFLRICSGSGELLI